jgi:hypothetical protein
VFKPFFAHFIVKRFRALYASSGGLHAVSRRREIKGRTRWNLFTGTTVKVLTIAPATPG